MDHKKHGVAIIYYCPADEPAHEAPTVIKYRYNAQTEFFDLLREATFFFGKGVQKMVLKDNFGTQWPLNRQVWRELAQLDRDIRLCPVEEEEEEVMKEEEVAAAEEEEEEEDATKTPTPRPPLWSELIVHLVFLVVLILHSTLGNNEKNVYDLNTAMHDAFFQKQFNLDQVGAAVTDQGAFSSPSVDDVADTRTSLQPRDLFEVKNMGDICTWLQEGLR